MNERRTRPCPCIGRSSLQILFLQVSGFSLLFLLFLAALEAGVLTWRRNVPVSTAPVFSWKGAPLLTSAPPPFGDALRLYRADRGTEQSIELPEGRKVSLFYFEWDNIELGPIIDIEDHPAEVCNVEHGSFKLLPGGGYRKYTSPNAETLAFDSTWLADQNNKPVFVYKMSWIQGFGGWAGAKPDDYFTRLRRSFLRGQGAGRVLEVGIFGATNEDEAWGLVQSEVLAKLEWQ